LERQGLKSDLELFEDGVISRQDLVLLNAGWGKQLRDARLFKPATDDEASDLRARYLEALDIDIQDDDLVESLLTMEKFTRLNMRHAVRAYLSTHEVIPEPACDGLQNDGKQILVPGGFKR
ncbi:MAG: hypothetical protein KDI65_00390, partial [Alphaproteobacteria bacterium]|nr:hypothetical protein [Alphaproteobacteria bacterium]